MKTETSILCLPRVPTAKLLGIGPRHFDAEVRPRIPRKHIHGTGAGLRFEVPAAIAAFVEMKVEQATPDADLSPGSGDSPALERARLATAKLRELELAQKTGQMIPRDEIENGLLRFAGAIRQAADMQQRRFGSECADMLNEALDEFERQCVAFIPMQSETTRLAI